MKSFIIEFNETGACKIDVDKVCDKWTDKMSISQYHDDFYLVKFGKGSAHKKVRISKEQAGDIIKKAKLFRINSSTFKTAWTYKKEEMIVSEIKRFDKMLEERQNEIRVINEDKQVYKQALFCKINETIDYQ